MKRLLSLAAVFSLLISGFAQAGVFSLIELPQLDAIMKENQSAVKDGVKTINMHGRKRYVFQPNTYAPHITLAFIDQDPNLTVPDILKKYPTLEQELGAIASTTKPIEITEVVENSSIVYWPGKAELKLVGGLAKKNYLNVVLKLETNLALKDLAAAVAQVLEKYGVKQRFEFSAHITLGTIFEENDGNLKKLPKRLIQEPLLPWHLDPIIITEFKIKGAHGSEKVFKFKTSK